MQQMTKCAALLLAFSLGASLLGGCKKTSDPRPHPQTYCQPLSKSVGGVIEYPNITNRSGPKRTISRFQEYKTAAGFTMRIPAGVGGLGHPNAQCEVDEGEFHFVWLDGQLLPSVDWEKGENRVKGTHVQYFVRFVRASGKKFDTPRWKLTDAFQVPEYEKVWLLPFGNMDTSDQIPKDRNDISKWWPALLFEEAEDFYGSVDFTCNYLRLTKVADAVQIHMPYEHRGTWCRGGFSFADGAGGRLDISSHAFMTDAAPIVRALVKELNSYVVKE